MQSNVQTFPVELLKEWFLANRRELPWREDPTPYRVWISEVMLQQTQVAVVIPYFEKWMSLFPTIEALAAAPVEQVLKCWEGLGYYSRARNLHKAARQLVVEYRGELPQNQEELSKIKGIGPYTQGAIRSFAFKQKAAAVDGNVLRVLSRYLALEDEIEGTKAQRRLREYAEAILPEAEPWIVSEALIELGATLCNKRAECSMCPLKQGCLAFRHHLQEDLPKRKKRQEIISLKREVAIVTCEDLYLIQKRASGQLMADLYEFPYLEVGPEKNCHLAFEESLNLNLTYIQTLPAQKQSFTRYRVQLFPHHFKTAKPAAGHLWKKWEDLKSFPFSSGHRKILSHINLKLL